MDYGKPYEVTETFVAFWDLSEHFKAHEGQPDRIALVLREGPEHELDAPLLDVDWERKTLTVEPVGDHRTFAFADVLGFQLRPAPRKD